MSLDAEALNETDRHILNILKQGRATPTLVMKFLNERGQEYSRQYVSQRLKRLTEHGHVENVRDTGVYELVEDPRNRSSE